MPTSGKQLQPRPFPQPFRRRRMRVGNKKEKRAPTSQPPKKGHCREWRFDRLLASSFAAGTHAFFLLVRLAAKQPEGPHFFDKPPPLLPPPHMNSEVLRVLAEAHIDGKKGGNVRIQWSDAVDLIVTPQAKGLEKKPGKEFVG